MNQFTNHQTNCNDCRESGAGETGRYEMRIIHMSITPSYRLRLEDGTCVFMNWHNYCGPTFYHDRREQRLLDEWYENPLVVQALDWFIGRGKRA